MTTMTQSVLAELRRFIRWLSGEQPPICGRCYDEALVSEATCDYRPETIPTSTGMHHCPGCGTMVMAGWTHPKMCEPCNTGKHPRLDRHLRPWAYALRESPAGSGRWYVVWYEPGVDRLGPFATKQIAERHAHERV